MSRKRATATLIHRPSLYFYRGVILIGLVLLVAREIHWGISSIGDDPTRRLDLNLFEHILLPTTDTNSTTADVPCTSQFQTKEAPQFYDEYAHDDNILVQYGDSIYVRTGWDAAPIVLEDYKVVFFTTAKVGCTVFKQLFRRMLGIPQWQAVNLPHLIPWNPEVNGLRYLYHYNRTAASHMMTAPDWTRAIFVRDPKTRFLSAYLDKVVGNPFFTRKVCCPTHRNCVNSNTSLSQFFQVVQTCNNLHWTPQARRMEAKYWPYINFVGHMESVQSDAEQFLRQIGAWDDFGQSGWGSNGTSAIFQSENKGSRGSEHATHAVTKLQRYYTTELAAQVDTYYKEDYRLPQLGLPRTRLFENVSKLP